MTKKLVIAIEGMDGSGKSSLIGFMKRLCEKYGQPFTQIGRREAHSSRLVGKMTRMLHRQAAELTPQADLFLRVARDHQRVELASSVPAGVVVLDRFVLSNLALARIHGQNVEAVMHLLKDLVARAHLHATIFVKCPFDVAWLRVKERNLALTPRGNRGEDFLRKMTELMDEEFEKGVVTAQRWIVDNSDELAVAEKQLAAHLLPYLQKTKV